MDSKPIVSIYDSDFIAFYVCHNKKNQDEKTLDDCIYLCNNFIDNINKAIKADYYIGYSTRGRCFRYNINPDYKANRKDAIFPKYSSQIRDYLVSKHGFKWIDNYEADDAVVSFKEQYSNEYDCIIVSPDKDILNLEGIHFNPKNMEFVTTSKQEADEYFWKSMIIGDPGDNVKGLKNKGKVYAQEIIDAYRSAIYPLYLGSNILNEYIYNLGELEGINEFYKNYRSLRLINSVNLGEIKLNEVTKTYSE